MNGRFWAGQDDTGTEAGGLDPPDGGPGSPLEDEAEARERVILQWVRAPSPPGDFGAIWRKVELLALDQQRRQELDTASLECVAYRRSLLLGLAKAYHVAPDSPPFLDHA